MLHHYQKQGGDHHPLTLTPPKFHLPSLPFPPRRDVQKPKNIARGLGRVVSSGANFDRTEAFQLPVKVFKDSDGHWKLSQKASIERASGPWRFRAGVRCSGGFRRPSARKATPKRAPRDLPPFFRRWLLRPKRIKGGLDGQTHQEGKVGRLQNGEMRLRTFGGLPSFGSPFFGATSSPMHIPLRSESVSRLFAHTELLNRSKGIQGLWAQ